MMWTLSWIGSAPGSTRSGRRRGTSRPRSSRGGWRSGCARRPPTRPATGSYRRRRPTRCTSGWRVTGARRPSGRPRDGVGWGDRRAAESGWPRRRAGGRMESDRPERQPQHLRRRGTGAVLDHPRRVARPGLRDRGHDPQQRPGDRLVGPPRAGRALLGAAEGRGPDNGAVRAGVSDGEHEVVVVDLDNTLCKLQVDWGEVKEGLDRLAEAAGADVEDEGIWPLRGAAQQPGREPLLADMERLVTDAELAGAHGPRNQSLVDWLPRPAGAGAGGSLRHAARGR